ncbi:S8 family serine peptidase [Puniceibacterium sp. IMCC21224]|uniref:S8 family serine peptidase n=1 Tax=Puniceibacterium sp. IMCC21224 TaxID=1618204 RepID=UPI00065D555D|nr:S8 family serine peptidase [Puniceibacterium sp. IMCC21224]KMK68467.1 subtilase family protease [Puniceibacterium sp. IMCC21224]
MSLEILRTAESFAASEPEPGLPNNRLRITLEYATPPDLLAQRARIEELLGGPNFDLKPLDDQLPEFLVLQFPGVERRMAPQTLFAAADALVVALDLVSAVPDIAATFVVAPDDPSRAEGVGDAILNTTCWVAEDTSLAPDWAVAIVNAPQVWAQGITGKGVTVAQPDSGVADHAELAGALDLSRAFNTLNGSTDPTDPLSSGMTNPGHGTATASNVASRGAGKVFGTAPGAKVVPIRCLNSVVLGLDPTPVAQAILHAVRIDADVISMSLGGGLHSPVMAAALKRAAKAGIIVVSAAGNCVQPIVVYPARDPNVIAMAGTNVHDKPWKGTSRGRKVDMAAPAENVPVARRTPGDGGAHRVKPSQGTSFATALTAGVAALWVQKWGRAKLRSEAARLSLSVTGLFRIALRLTARTPANWPRGMGAGIVDAAALVGLDPAHIQRPGGSGPSSLETAGPLVAALDDSFDGIEAGDDDWPRIGAETIYLLNDAWVRTHRVDALPLESATRPAPSPGTKARLPAQVEAALNQHQSGPLMQPPIAAPAPAQPDYARYLAAGRMGTAESSATLTPEAARGRLMSEPGQALSSRVGDILSKMQKRGEGDRNAQAEVVQQAQEVIRMVAEDRIPEIDGPHRATLEALVRLTDRPAYRIVNGTIDEDDPLYGEWGGFLSLSVDLPHWARSVGRIDLNGVHVGTGFLIGGNRVMTNRHVLEAVADEIIGPNGSAWDFGRGRVTIDFSDTADGVTVSDLNGVAITGPVPVSHSVDFANLDMAVLNIVAGGPDLPPPLDLRGELRGDIDLAVIGYPARHGSAAYINPATGRPDVEIGQRLRAIFGTDFGRKYVAPGRVIQQPGTLPGDRNDWVFSHDCTTLGGNSGSMIVQFAASPGVAGLHFSGATLYANHAHALGAVNAAPSGPIPGATWI